MHAILPARPWSSPSASPSGPCISSPGLAIAARCGSSSPNLIDLTLPFALVLPLGVGLDRWPRPQHPAVRATAVLLIGAAVELLQFHGVPLVGRTFDPLDLLMYAAGAMAALAFERVAFPSCAQPGAQPRHAADPRARA